MCASYLTINPISNNEDEIGRWTDRETIWV